MSVPLGRRRMAGGWVWLVLLGTTLAQQQQGTPQLRRKRHLFAVDEFYKEKSRLTHSELGFGTDLNQEVERILAEFTSYSSLSFSQSMSMMSMPPSPPSPSMPSPSMPSPSMPSPSAPSMPSPSTPSMPSPSTPSAPSPSTPSMPSPSTPSMPSPSTPSAPSPSTPSMPSPSTPSMPSPSTPSAPSPSMPSPSTPSAPTPFGCLEGTTREAYLLDRLTNAGVPSSELEDPSTPQGQAFDWMVSEDTTDPCGSNTEQRFALTTFYYATDGGDWTTATNWLTDTSECDWWGVTCPDDAEGRVTELTLEDNNLGGSLPDELALMPSVEVLSLYNNQIGGTIPSVLSGWVALKNLDLEVNQLTGPAFIDTTNMNDLQFYTVSVNQLTGTIPFFLGSNSMLESLWVGENEGVTGELPTELGLLTNMVDLYVFNCSLVGPLPEELAAMTRLAELQAQGNDLTGTIPNGMTDLTEMNTLRLDRNKLTGTIPNGIGNLVLLEDLRLNNNFLAGAVPPGMEFLTSLETFRLNNNTLTGTFVDELGGWSDIEFFDIGFNQFAGPLPESLFTPAKESLRIVYFRNNQFSGPLSNAYANSPSLADFYINGNQLTGEVMEIPSGALPNLNEFLLQENDLVGSMPGSVCDLFDDMLEDLWADCDKIECDCCTRCFPDP